MTDKERTLLELERLKPSIDEYIYTLAVHWVKYGANQYRSAYDVIEAVERSQEDCPF